MGVCHTDGCHFLTLLSIAEEESNKTIDLIDAIRVSQSKGWIDSEFFVKNDGTPILEYYTGHKWNRTVSTILPAQILDNQYTEVCYYNKVTKDNKIIEYRHFRRRYIDTLENSNTVKNGQIEKYYIYTCVR